MSNADTLVTVTGISGFIAMHCARELLREGYSVRGTLRSLDKEAAVRAALVEDEGQGRRLSFAAANLTDDAGWAEAVAGARYVMHVASPVPAEEPADEQVVIRPAVEGTLRVLRAAREARVARVVLTSSVAAILSGHDYTNGRTFTEDDWSDLDGQDVQAYQKSKTLAERAAWDFVDALEGDATLELCTINPVYVLGPSLLGRDNASNEVVRKLLAREVPGVPRFFLGLVDVRDVAHAHVLAMTTPDAAGKRFIVQSDTCWMAEIARALKAEGFRVSTLELPNLLVRLVALFDKTVAMVVPSLGQKRSVSAAQAERVLGWHGRDMKSMVLDTARDMSARA